MAQSSREIYWSAILADFRCRVFTPPTTSSI